MTRAIERWLDAIGTAHAGEWAELVQSVWRIALVLLLAWVAVRLAHRLVNEIKAYVARIGGDAERQKRVETLARVFRHTFSALAILVTGMVVLGDLGISIAPILATAGVVGIAIGFGAQTLIKDCLGGLLLVIENQVRQGDVVEVAGKGGLVEEMTLRYIRLRDYEGNVHYVPNGAITAVTNFSRAFAFAVIDVTVAYREDLDSVFATMQAVAAELQRDASYGPRIIGEFELAGVDRWADSAVVIRCRFKVLPLEQWGVRREYLRRLKKTFDASGIEIPYPHLTVYPGRDADGRPYAPVVRDAPRAGPRGEERPAASRPAQ